MNKDTKKTYLLKLNEQEKLYLEDEEGHLHSAKEVLSVYPHRTIYALDGKMGAGKTTFVRQLCEELGTDDIVNSPTFAIVNIYDVPSREGGTEEVYHFDCYRLNNIEEALNIGIEDYFHSGNLCLVEWPEKIERLLPEETVWIRFEVLSDGNRKLEISDKHFGSKQKYDLSERATHRVG